MTPTGSPRPVLLVGGGFGRRDHSVPPPPLGSAHRPLFFGGRAQLQQVVAVSLFRSNSRFGFCFVLFFNAAHP